MSSPWVQHVKAHATANNITYKQALTEAKYTYRPNSAGTPATGGSKKSGYVRKLIATGEVNVSKIKKPSEWLKENNNKASLIKELGDKMRNAKNTLFEDIKKIRYAVGMSYEHEFRLLRLVRAYNESAAELQKIKGKKYEVLPNPLDLYKILVKKPTKQELALRRKELEIDPLWNYRPPPFEEAKKKNLAIKKKKSSLLY